jgi:hypothetical protein
MFWRIKFAKHFIALVFNPNQRMNFLERLFGTTAKSENRAADAARVQMIKENTDKLWQYLDETLIYYNSLGCPCAFPRFRQIAAIDCVDFGKSFYVSETEGFISMAGQYYKIQDISDGGENSNQLWTCNTCNSTFHCGWSDFSIHVNRTFLKSVDLKVTDIGAETTLPVPLFVGLFGHNFPDHSHILPVDYQTFTTYIRELKAQVIS